MERQTGHQTIVNNDFYNQLHEGWYTRYDHPIALLRAENAARIPWIGQVIGSQTLSVLDIGCGGGLLANALSLQGHEVTGVDISESSLEIAKAFDTTKKVRYLNANAYSLPFIEGEFSAVCAMDVLEHVDEPARLIAEASRVLKPGGLFFFHTFNRNLFSYFLIIKGVEWFVKNTPPNMHTYPLFIKPKEMQAYCHLYKLDVIELRGLTPRLNAKALFELCCFRRVARDFSFQFTKSLATGYCGIARKKNKIES